MAEINSRRGGGNGQKPLSGSAAYRKRQVQFNAARWAPSWLAGAKWPRWCCPVLPKGGAR